MEVKHKGWDWTEIDSSLWDKVSEEFFPIAYSWIDRFHSILDIGAGKGRHSFYFAEYGFDVSAVDLSASSVEYITKISRENNYKVHAEVADMTELPFDENTFDGVICFHTIYHTDYKGVEKALAEIQRVLKNNGEAFISFNTKDNPSFIESEAHDGYTMIKKEGIEKGVPHCYLSEMDVIEILSEFKVISLNKIQNYIRKADKAHGIHFYAHLVNKK